MKRPLRIILVDEDARSAALVEAALRAELANLQLQLITGADAFARALAAGEFALAITEHKLSWSNAIEVTRAIKLCRGNTPVIVFTSAGDEAAAVAAMKAGADDYIGKDADRIDRLLAAVRAAISDMQQPAVALAPNRTGATEQHLRAALENLPISIFAQDRALRYTWMYHTLLSPCDAAVLGKTDSELLPAEDALRLLRVKQRVLDSGRPAREEIKIGRDGKERYLDLRVEPLHADDGAVVGIICSALDVTEHKNAEQQLRAARSRLEFLLRATPAMLYNCSTPDVAITFVSENAAVELGYQPQEFVRDRAFWRDRLHPDDAPRVLAEMPKLLAQGRQTLEYRFLTKQGGYRWLHDEARVIYDDDGQPSEVVGYCLDITERKDAEAQLARQATQMMEAQRIARIGSWDWDIAADSVTWSDEHYRIFGLEPRAVDISYQAFQHFVHPDDRHMVERAMRDAWTDLKPYSISFRIRRVDGAERHLYSRAEIAWDDRGKPLRMWGTVQDVTERKQAEDALEQSEQRFATFMNHLPGAAFIRDRQGNYLYCNPVEMQRLKRPSTWRGKNLDDLWPADVAALARQNDLRVLESGQAMQYILNTPDTDGPPYWLVTKFPILDEQGAAQLIGGIGIDITERKHVEEQLRATQARLQFLLSSTPAVIYTCKAGDEHAAAFVSDNVTAQLGYQAREFVDDPQFWRSRVHPDDVERVLAGLCNETGQDRHIQEYRFLHQDGTYRWLLDEARLIRDAHGVPLEVAGYLIDITQRKTAEAEVGHHATQMAEAQRVAHVGSWELDLQSGALLWSEEHYRVFGVEPGKFTVSHAAAMQLVHPDDRESLGQTLEATAKAGGSYNMHFRIVGGDGKERHIFSRGVTVVGATGRALRMLGTVQDVTERKRFEDALQESERQLREALEQRERLFQDLHDSIIQIIYAVGLSLEECQRLIDEGRGAVAVRTIAEAIGNLNSAIRDIRKFILGHDAKILTGTQLRAELADLARSVMAAQLLRLRVSIDPMAASQLTSEEARHVLCIAREAMSNSLRHSRARSGMVSLRANRSSVRLEVRDDGVGFDMQQAAWRGEGLHNIAARARLMGARLDISSQPGSGTRIVVNLPKETTHGNGQNRENALADR